MTEDTQSGRSEGLRNIINPLPFTYERTFDPSVASFHEWRVSPVSSLGKKNEPRTDERIVQMVTDRRENQDWYTSYYWRRKGLPQEQVEIDVNGKGVTVYNFDRGSWFDEEHIKLATSVLGKFTSRFPSVLDKVSWILVDDIQLTSAFGDPENYPTNGGALREFSAFQLYPRGMELIPHRVEAVTNFTGTLTHELTHLIASEFEDEWKDKFKWAGCLDYPEDWELRPTPEGQDRKFYNKKTGEMSPQNQFPLEPDQCVNYYAKQNMSEDICESMVAYLFDPELLRRISPDKFRIFQGHDAGLPIPNITSSVVPQSEIRLPEIKPEVIHYYIKEPQAPTK